MLSDQNREIDARTQNVCTEIVAQERHEREEPIRVQQHHQQHHQRQEGRLRLGEAEVWIGSAARGQLIIVGVGQEAVQEGPQARRRRRWRCAGGQEGRPQIQRLEQAKARSERIARNR